MRFVAVASGPTRRYNFLYGCKLVGTWSMVLWWPLGICRDAVHDIMIHEKGSGELFVYVYRD